MHIVKPTEGELYRKEYKRRFTTDKTDDKKADFSYRMYRIFYQQMEKTEKFRAFSIFLANFANEEERSSQRTY
ncbi:hypothetical protein D8S85_13930 [Butyricimonas faecalis]|uniref:Uncharacterized protein n=1 Tax=Butyricimonas faecalis TaxID=2093856 RepID=A0A3S9VVF3_9BACT|nr:hypothetical protein D8S85_13930 [Butyricimonas faecalis]